MKASVIANVQISPEGDDSGTVNFALARPGDSRYALGSSTAICPDCNVLFSFRPPDAPDGTLKQFRFKLRDEPESTARDSVFDLVCACTIVAHESPNSFAVARPPALLSLIRARGPAT